MFSKLFGKGQPPVNAATKESMDSRGLEVIEDDPDTAWSRWDDALAEQDTRFSEMAPLDSDLPTIIGSHDGSPSDFDSPTMPQPLEEKSLERRKSDALGIVERHHSRIAKTINTLWGYKECSLYINKLILAGDDGSGHARAGFNQDAAEAMLALAEVHDAMFGTFGRNEEFAFGDPIHRPKWEGSR